MSNSTAATFWDFPFQPQAHQDRELLRDLAFVPGLKELLMVRQVHALEHGTVWVLGELMGTTTDHISGMSTENGFYLYGELDGSQLERAVRLASQRLTSGEWELAVHPRCGTNMSVGLLLTMGLAVGVSLATPKDPLTQLLGFGLATVTASQLAPDLGYYAQKYLTTAIPFNLHFEKIEALVNEESQPGYFVSLSWLD